MTTYLDASVVLDRVVDEEASRSLWRGIDRTASSVLCEVECLRAIDRFRVLGQMDDVAQARARETVYRILETSEVIGLGQAVLERASNSLPFAIKTLDALHLATAMIYRETVGPMNLATNDKALARAARSMGFEVLGAA